MGSCGSYSADAYISVPTKQREKNTEEVIEILRAKNLKKIVEVKDYEGKEFYKIDSDIIELITKKLTEIPGINLKIKYGYSEDDCCTLDVNPELEKALVQIEKKIDSDDSIYQIYYETECTDADLAFYNLDVINLIKLKVITDTYDYSLCSVSESIYWENDNSSFNSIDIDDSLRKILSIPGARICLEGNGSGY